MESCLVLVRMIRKSRCAWLICAMNKLSTWNHTDLGHRKETDPPRVRRTPTGDLFHGLFPRWTFDHIWIGRRNSQNMGHDQCRTTHSRLLIPVFCRMVIIDYVKILTINDPNSPNNDAGVTSVSISPNGQFVAAGSLDTVVRIWDMATGVLVDQLRGHRDSVYSVTFTPDGKGLVSGSLDKILKFWDVSWLSEAYATRSVDSHQSPRQVIKSPCTMNFIGHKVHLTFFVFFIKADPTIAGFCPLRWSFARRTMGCLRFQRPWSTVLGC